jgi:tetratricopeptide (TPR) repeat protein
MPDSTGSDPLLFLSHSGSDTEAARNLKRRIEDAPDARQRGLKVWFDKDDLRPGKPWQAQLEDAIARHATAFAVYVGARGIINWVDAEVRLGLSRAIAGNGQRFPFIPVLAAGAKSSDSLPGFAFQFQGVRDVESNPDEFQKLLGAILGDGGVGLRELEKEPFFGLKAIDETRSYLFFGREHETEELIKRLSEINLLMVTGDSGSGKSSLVRAGLIPRWRGGALAELKGRRPDEEIWHVIETRPGHNPLRSLGDAVFEAAKRLGESAADRGTYKDWVTSGQAEKFRDGLRCGLDAGRTRTLLVIDQFEELLTLTPQEQRQPYVDLLLTIVDKDDAFTVVLTMRRDYYNLCYEFQLLYTRFEANDRRARYLVGRMRDEDMHRVITEPLKLAGIDKGDREALARNVLSDVGERSGDLALVQFALTKTWEHRKEYDNDLLRSYSALGRVEGALAQAAEKVYVDPILGGDANEREIEAVFLRLVKLGDTGGAIRRVARHSEFSEARWGMLQALAEERGSRLVQISGPEMSERAEIAHEALVTQWPRFQRWLQAAAGDKRTLDGLIERAAKWISLDRASNSKDDTGKDQYFATGAELQLFEDFAKRHRDWLSPNEIDYVDASSAARRREETRRRWLFRSVAAASILFALAAATAWFFYLTATKQTQIAEQQKVVAEQQKAEAEQQRSEAQRQRAEAERQAVAAGEQTSEAVRQKSEAIKQEQIAQKEREQAIAPLSTLLSAGAESAFTGPRLLSSDDTSALLAKAIERDPNNPYLYIWRALSDQKLDTNLAIVDITNALALRPQMTELYQARGVMYVYAGKIDEALSDLDKAIMFDQTSVLPLAYHSALRAQKMQFDGAIEDANEMIKRQPDYPQLYWIRSIIYARKRDYSKASADLSEALKRTQKDNMWQLFYTVKRARFFAEDYYNNIISVISGEVGRNPNNANELFKVRGGVYAYKEDYGHAIRDFSEAIKREQKDWSAYRLRSYTYTATGDVRRAQADEREAMRLSQR